MKDKLYLDVRSLIISYSRGHSFSKEALAIQYEVEQHEIAHILHKMNLEGWVTQAYHHNPSRWSGGRHIDPYHPDTYYRTDKPIKGAKPLRDLPANELEQFVGQMVSKISGKPFKSKSSTATIEKIVVHPFTQRPAFLLKEDQTVVEAGQCKLLKETV